MISQPIFLVGAERSGTTVLRLMLRNHSQLFWCSEFEYVVDLISDEGEWPNLETYYEWLSTNRIFLASKLKIDRSLNYPELVDNFLAQRKVRAQKPRIGATVHRHFDRLLRIWPDARFIHILRDGRDVARSCIGMGWAGNVWTGIERWIDAENLWPQLKSSLSEDRYVEVTYESLIGKPQQTLEEICSFIGIDFEVAMLEYYKTTTYSAPDPQFLYQWKRKLSEREIQLVESRIAPMLLERNYELSGLPIIEVDQALEQRLRFDCWWKRAQFRMERVGLYLFAADYISRRLNIKPWQKKVQLQMNEIAKSYLK